jgi:hypothetical protein
MWKSTITKSMEINKKILLIIISVALPCSCVSQNCYLEIDTFGTGDEPLIVNLEKKECSNLFRELSGPDVNLLPNTPDGIEFCHVIYLRNQKKTLELIPLDKEFMPLYQISSEVAAKNSKLLRKYIDLYLANRKT